MIIEHFINTVHIIYVEEQSVDISNTEVKNHLFRNQIFNLFFCSVHYKAVHFRDQSVSKTKKFPEGLKHPQRKFKMCKLYHMMDHIRLL